MTTRDTFDLPPVDSGLILTKVHDGSALQRVSRRIELPGTGSIVHTFSTGDAAYVTEGGRKPITDSTGASLTVSAEKFTKVVFITEELSEDSPALATAIYDEIPKSFSSTFDKIIIGALTKPSGNFDNLAGAPTLELSTVASAYAAISAVEAKDVDAEAWVFTSAMFNELAGKVNDLGTPVFNFANGEFLGLPFVVVRAGLTKAAWVGPFESRSVYGIVDGTPKVVVSTEGTLIAEDGTVISLLQENKIGVVAEIRFGFRVADITEFVKLTPAITS